MQDRSSIRWFDSPPSPEFSKARAAAVANSGEPRGGCQRTGRASCRSALPERKAL